MYQAMVCTVRPVVLFGNLVKATNRMRAARMRPLESECSAAWRLGCVIHNVNKVNNNIVS